MLRSRSLIALVALALGACGRDNEKLDIEDVRVVKVRGDQVAPAGSTAGRPLHAEGPRFMAAAAAGEWSPELLVGRIEVAGARSASLLGPSSLPPNLMVHWDIEDGAGRLAGFSTPPDDSLYVLNRWAPGTKAGTYQAVARRILADGTIMEDARWTLVVEPGPVAQVQLAEMPSLCIGDTLDMRNYIARGWDAYGNEIPVDTVRALPDDAVSWQWEEAVQGYTGSGPVVSGWTVVVPDFGQHGYTKRTTKDGFGYYTVSIISSLSSKYVAAAHISRVYICN